jgi:hypothetical protein
MEAFMRRTAALLFFTLSSGSYAADAGVADPKDRCVINPGKGDRAAKGKDVVVEAGEKIEDAVAVDGSVFVKNGGEVKNAMALHGNIVVEAGARVRGNAIAVGGKITIVPGARLEGSQISLDRALNIVGDNGSSVKVSASLGGKGLAREILKPILDKLKDCDVAPGP